MLYPDVRVKSFRDVDRALLERFRIKAVVYDIDETLVPFGEVLPSGDIKTYFKQLKEDGVLTALVSNSPRARVSKFADKLQIPYFYRAGKPFIKGLRAAQNIFGIPSNEIAMVGDQLFTDILAGQRAGMFTILVDPVLDRDSIFFKCKRAAERFILRKKGRER